MTLTGSGNLGIGTTSPDCALDVQTSGNETKILIQNDTLALLQLRQPTNNYVWNLEIGRTDGEFSMRNGDGEKLRIKANGYVGIGTTSPSTKFTVGSSAAYQSIRLEDSNGNNKINMASSGSGGSGHAYFNLWDSSNTQSVQIHSSPDHDTWFNCKNVGIGTSSPSEKLEVNGTMKSSGAVIGNTSIGKNSTYSAFLNLQHASLSGTSSYAMLQSSTGDTYLNCASGKTIYFRENGDYNNDNMVIQGGKIGIGTNSPKSILNIYKANPELIIQDTEASSNNADVSLIFSDSDDNGGINHNYRIRYNHRDLIFSEGDYPNNTHEVMRFHEITSAGDVYVGIGTDSQDYRLDVNGTARVTGQFDIYGGTRFTHFNFGTNKFLPEKSFYKMESVMSASAQLVIN